MLTFTRRFAHPPERVWRAVSEPEHQAVWFPQQIVGERRTGAALRFVTSVDPDEGFDGEMGTYDPPRVMELPGARAACASSCTPRATAPAWC